MIKENEIWLICMHDKDHTALPENFMAQTAYIIAKVATELWFLHAVRMVSKNLNLRNHSSRWG